MSSPYEDQPGLSPDPRNGQQPWPPQPPQNLPPQQYWQAAPPPPRHSNGLAIAALVVASLALLTGLGFVVSQIVVGAMFGGLMGSGDGFSSFDSGLLGTAPQVVAGQGYPGRLLQDEVTRVVGGSLGEVTSMSCPATPSVVADAVTVCHGKIDGSDASFKVTFEDGLGHFTLDEKVD
jgi:hypothetical protein